MPTFFDRFSALCKESGETPNSLGKKLGISSGSITAWKNGTIPRTKTLDMLAGHFRVSVDYLIGNVCEPYFYLDNERIKQEINSYGADDEKAPTPKGERYTSDLVNGDQELTEFLQMLRDRPECRMLFSISKNASKEDVEKAVAIIEALRGMEGRR